jgi:putative spermidine/putrescine transport system substrate-binding protein
VTECGIQLLVCGVVIGYDANQFKGNEPTKLADFWDIKKFPGPRCMKKWPKHNMEFALLADGVAPGDLYKVLSTEEGIARAFKKMDEIKPHVKVWFNSWAQPGQLMADGEVAMSTGTNGRLLVAQKSHSNVKFMWDNQGLTSDNWSVVKGCKHKELALEFVKFACQPENQAEFPKHIAYGPTHKKAISMMSPELAKQMPSHPNNMDVVWKIDSRWWSDHNDDLSIRFNAWLAK